MKNAHGKWSNTLVVASLGIALGMPLPAGAEIYKWTDAEGNVHFSDEAPKGAKKLELKPLPVMNLPMPERHADLGKTAAELEKEKQGYSVLAVTKPAHDAKLDATDGQLSVTASLEPDLRKGHMLQVWVDGQKAGPADTATALSARDLQEGERKLKVVVLNAQGEPLQSSAEIRIFVQKPGTADRK